MNPAPAVTRRILKIGNMMSTDDIDSATGYAGRGQAPRRITRLGIVLTAHYINLAMIMTIVVIAILDVSVASWLVWCLAVVGCVVYGFLFWLLAQTDWCDPDSTPK